MADELAVWLYGERVAMIDRERGRPRLVYTREALGGYALSGEWAILREPDRLSPADLSPSFRPSGPRSGAVEMKG
jgi:hypothetical protein